MAIVIEAAGGNSAKETTTVQFTLDIGSAPNRCWVIAACWCLQNGVVSSVTVGTDTLTLSTTLQTTGVNGSRSQLWYGTTTLTGLQTVTITLSVSTDFLTCGGYALSGVDQASPMIDEAGAASTTGTTITAPALSGGDADSLALDGMEDCGTSSIGTSDNTSEWSNSIESTHGQGSSAVGSGPTMGYTSLSNNMDHTISSILLRAASAAAPVENAPMLGANF